MYCNNSKILTKISQINAIFIKTFKNVYTNIDREKALIFIYGQYNETM